MGKRHIVGLIHCCHTQARTETARGAGVLCEVPVMMSSTADYTPQQR